MFILMGLLGINNTIDINVHDIYIVIDFWVCMLFCVILFFSFGLWYWICYRFKLQLSNWLSLIHAIGTGVSLIIIFYYLGFEPKLNLPRRYLDTTYYQEIIIGNIILFLVSQIAMVINSLRLLIRRIKVLIRK